ncbi:WecB/TagA/CpsF family glycosyltransferase [Dinghuibacter silviterrae]|uniref:N-acetylglucosaminyldiphosphoundecaprenol N-acetyl-beta-D-mannosaminyltransferase n=1 Tax=Dinghuibacter silviterrae TaxID=1539049 RepID=A0A4R8DUD1_9BACT|nr:WecB/TagA/CpsF family glycosyltransferase [Dinghuibacter silviterrae]TDX01769.1 N-acetylglucosaminyldiphosphoundecaprenol N-acetyl-beta-D-mannosaminyltransferase [Dinghuibacter silviterrae]
MYKSVDVLGYNVFSGTLADLDGSRKHLINTFSPNSYGLAVKDEGFKKALKGTDVLVLDGMGVAIGSMLIHGKNIKKIAGQDCFDYLMARAEEGRWKVFFLGSSPKTLDKISARAAQEFPHITLGSYSPPFKSEFSEADNQAMVDAINAFEPHVLFIGMTAPKQEKWGYEQRDAVNARVICAIGNVFDWYAGNSKRPAKIWVTLRLEWLVRIFIRPEIFKRNTGNQMVFFKDVLLHLLHIKRTK